MAEEKGEEKPVVAFLGPKASYTHQVGATKIIFAPITSLVMLTRAVHMASKPLLSTCHEIFLTLYDWVYLLALNSTAAYHDRTPYRLSPSLTPHRRHYPPSTYSHILSTPQQLSKTSSPLCRTDMHTEASSLSKTRQTALWSLP
jgi:hypothetical protein